MNPANSTATIGITNATRRGNTLRDREVGGSNPLAPILFKSPYLLDKTQSLRVFHEANIGQEKCPKMTCFDLK
jgi:hypothetical protein